MQPKKRKTNKIMKATFSSTNTEMASANVTGWLDELCCYPWLVCGSSVIKVDENKRSVDQVKGERRADKSTDTIFKCSNKKNNNNTNYSI